jgi:hypothetical protein
MSNEKEVRQLILTTDRNYTVMQLIIEEVQNMSVQLDALRQEVAENNSVTRGAIDLISGLRNQIAQGLESGFDPEEVESIVRDIDKNTNELATAVAANTKVDPVAPIADVVTEPKLEELPPVETALPPDEPAA